MAYNSRSTKSFAVSAKTCRLKIIVVIIATIPTKLSTSFNTRNSDNDVYVAQTEASASGLPEDKNKYKN